MDEEVQHESDVEGREEDKDKEEEGEEEEDKEDEEEDEEDVIWLITFRIEIMH